MALSPHPRKSLIEENKGVPLFMDRPHFNVPEPLPVFQTQPKRQVKNKTQIPIIKNGRTIYKTVYMADQMPESPQSNYKDADNYKCIKCDSK